MVLHPVRPQWSRLAPMPRRCPAGREALTALRPIAGWPGDAYAGASGKVRRRIMQA